MGGDVQDLVCVLCGAPWEPPIKNRCECGGFCSWGEKKDGPPSSWNVHEDGSWSPKPPPRMEQFRWESQPPLTRPGDDSDSWEFGEIAAKSVEDVEEWLRSIVAKGRGNGDKRAFVIRISQGPRLRKELRIKEES